MAGWEARFVSSRWRVVRARRAAARTGEGRGEDPSGIEAFILHRQHESKGVAVMLMRDLTKKNGFAACAFAIAAIAGCAFALGLWSDRSSAAAGPEPGLPAVITSAGQSPDGLVVKVLLTDKQRGPLADYKALAKPEDIAGAKTLIVAVGVSSKGLGSAGVNVEQEIARVRSLLETAKKNGMYVVLVHMGGTARRGAKSDEIAQLVAGYAHKIIVLAAGNDDGFFDKLGQQHNIPVSVVKDRTAAGVELLSMLSAK